MCVCVSWGGGGGGVSLQKLAQSFADQQNSLIDHYQNNRYERLRTTSEDSSVVRSPDS